MASVIGGPAFELGDPLWELAASIVSHSSPLHVAKNVLAFAISAAVIEAWGRWRYAAIALLTAPAVNYGVALVGGNVRGASGGTFALLGIAAAYTARESPLLTAIALTPLVLHQVTVAQPAVAAGHAGAFVVGALFAAVLEDLRRWPAEGRDAQPANAAAQ